MICVRPELKSTPEARGVGSAMPALRRVKVPVVPEERPVVDQVMSGEGRVSKGVLWRRGERRSGAK